MADKVVFDRPDAWQYDDEAGTLGYHVAEVEVLGNRRWLVWENIGYQVNAVELCEGREDAGGAMEGAVYIAL